MRKGCTGHKDEVDSNSQLKIDKSRISTIMHNCEYRAEQNKQTRNQINQKILDFDERITNFRTFIDYKITHP